MTAKALALGLWCRAQGRFRRFTVPEPVRWGIYLLVCAAALSFFLWGYWTTSAQDVAFEGKVVTGRGAELYFEGDDVGKVGVFQTTANKVVVLRSQRGSIEVKLIAAKGECEALVEEFGVSLGTCEGGPGANSDVLRINEGRTFSLEFSEPTPIKATLRSARAVRVVEREGESFPTARAVEFHLCRGANWDTAGAAACPPLTETQASDSTLELEVRNQSETSFDLHVKGLSQGKTTRIPWRSSQANPGHLVLRVDWPGEARTLAFMTEYEHLPISFSVSSNADFIRVKQASGVVDVAGQRKAVLDTDILEVRAKKPGRVSMTDRDISFRVDAASEVVVRKANARNDRGRNILRRRLETWPIWLQAIAGVLVSGLIVQVFIRRLLPKSLKD